MYSNVCICYIATDIVPDSFQIHYTKKTTQNFKSNLENRNYLKPANLNHHSLLEIKLNKS